MGEYQLKKIAQPQLNDKEVDNMQKHGYGEHEIRSFLLNDNLSIVCSFFY